MPVFSITFNKLQILIPAQNLSLSVDSSVSLQCPSENPQPVKPRLLLDRICFGKIWIAYGNGCRIDFVFPSGPITKDSALEKTIEGFASCVRNMPLWSQVSLITVIKPLERGSSGAVQPGFSVFLERAPLLKISNDSRGSLPPAASDVQVPISVPCFQLRKIKINMTFNFIQARDFFPASAPSMTVNSIRDNFTKTVSGPFPGTDLIQDHDMLDDDDFFHRIDIAIPSPITEPLLKSSPALPSDSTSQEEAVKISPIDCGMITTASNLNRAREMANLAFRKLVGGRQNQNQGGIKVVQQRPALTLSKLAPSLFSPGFSEAMSHRSQFIPTISHAFSVSLLRNAQSPSLRRKLLSLSSSPIKASDADTMFDSLDEVSERSNYTKHHISHKLSQTLEERLWVMLHCSLNHPLLIRHAIPPEDMNTASAARLGEMSTTTPGGTENGLEALIHSTNRDLDFLEEEGFEDLFECPSDEESYANFENRFDESSKEIIVDDNFEDIFEDEVSADLDEEVHARLVRYVEDSGKVTNYGVRYWEYSENTDFGDPRDTRSTEDYDTTGAENEDMLF